MGSLELTISESLFDELNLPSDALLGAAIRHERRLSETSIEPLREIVDVGDDVRYWFRYLLVMCFFFDYSLDRAREEQFPEAMFISASMFSTYRKHVEDDYSSEGVSLLWRNYSDQLEYQILEKQWNRPSEYCRLFSDCGNYYRKVQLCFTELELLALGRLNQSTVIDLIELYKRYWNLVLLADDIVDVEKDLHDLTLTPQFVMFLKVRGRMPSVTDIDTVRSFGKGEFDRILKSFEDLAERLDADKQIAIVDKMRSSVMEL